ncbi:MAG: hypothetical protein HQK49_21210 [Oligoflexia bacterium]|nr:hypothetical protein [Oligoflexia bacterium]
MKNAEKRKMKRKMCHTPNGSNSTLVAIELPEVKWHHHFHHFLSGCIF